LIVSATAAAQNLPNATIEIVKDTPKIKVHTLVSAGDMFANASHVIELKSQLIVIDGQFFAQYGKELRAFTDSLGKPVTRFYVSHDHPDHYLGAGDAFPDVKVLALKETKDAIDRDGQAGLEARQKQMGPMIASKLFKPTAVVATGTELIDGVSFVFEKWTDNEAEVSLVVKLPELGVIVTQDIVYNHVHLFISGPTQGWKNALQKLKRSEGYTVFLPGHGRPASRSTIDEDIAYLDTVDALLKSSKTKEAYKAGLAAAYPNYAALGLVDIYWPILRPGDTAAPAQ
jgi:glyoxylase-like metal-dependent hydrolase (beta-lactamase superfamily II)